MVCAKYFKIIIYYCFSELNMLGTVEIYNIWLRNSIRVSRQILFGSSYNLLQFYLLPIFIFKRHRNNDKHTNHV